MIRSHQLLGVTVHPLSSEALLAAVAEAVGSGQLRIIGNHNLHSIYLYHRDERFRAFYQRTHLNHVDGISIVFVGRLLGMALRREDRATSVDWMHPLMALAAARGWRVMYLGAAEGVVQRGAAYFRSCHRGLVIETMHGFFDVSRDGEENRTVLGRIRAFQPQLLMVGMGMPRQEHWILENACDLPPCVVLNVGAAMDYVAGAIPTPPRWTGRLGLEWLSRLVSEPRRLWRRYLVEPWFVLAILVRELIAGPTRGNSEPGGED